MRAVVTPTFARTAKKLHATEKRDLDGAVRAIAADPALGDAKLGDLAGGRVFKFRMARQPCLLAYSQESEETIRLLAIGSHENFYRDLKKS